MVVFLFWRNFQEMLMVSSIGDRRILIRFLQNLIYPLDKKVYIKKEFGNLKN